VFVRLFSGVMRHFFLGSAVELLPGCFFLFLPLLSSTFKQQQTRAEWVKVRNHLKPESTFRAVVYVAVLKHET